MQRKIYFYFTNSLKIEPEKEYRLFFSFVHFLEKFCKISHKTPEYCQTLKDWLYFRDSLVEDIREGKLSWSKFLCIERMLKSIEQKWCHVFYLSIVVCVCCLLIFICLQTHAQTHVRTHIRTQFAVYRYLQRFGAISLVVG